MKNKTATVLPEKTQLPKADIFFILLLSLQICLLISYMNKKTGWFIDEIFSYGLSNCSNGGVLYPEGTWNDDINDRIFNKWISGRTFAKYITVQEGEKFAYKHVWQNQEKDNHPPLYYLILHTICSFFPEAFSKWQGFSINIVCFIFTQILLFAIGKRILKSDIQALLLCAFYGFGISAINNFVYIRMYALFTVLSLGLLLAVLKLGDKTTSENKCLFAISLLIFLGCMTHYHFYVYAFFLILVKLLIFLYDKQYKSAGKLATAALIPVILAITIYPAIITHMQTSPRAREAFGGVKHEDSLWKFCWVFMFAINYITGLSFELSETLATALYTFIDVSANLFPLLLLIGAIFCVKQENKSKAIKTLSHFKTVMPKDEFKDKLLIFIPVLLFWITIAPTLKKEFYLFIARYFFFLMPIFSLAIFLALRSILSKIFKKTAYLNSFLGLIITIACLFSNVNDTKNFTLPVDDCFTAKTYSNLVQNKSIFWMTPGEGELHAMAPLFMCTKQIFPSRLENLDKISQAIKTLPKTEEILLFIPEFLKKDTEVLQEVTTTGSDIVYLGRCFSWLYYNVYTFNTEMLD